MHLGNRELIVMMIRNHAGLFSGMFWIFFLASLITAFLRRKSDYRKGVYNQRNLNIQLIFLAGFPIAMAILFVCIAPEFMLPAIHSRFGLITVLVLLSWEAIGIMFIKHFVKPGDPKAIYKMLFSCLMFFFPVVFVIIFGPLVINLITHQ